MAEGAQFAEAETVTEMNTKEQRAAFKSLSAEPNSDIVRAK